MEGPVSSLESPERPVERPWSDYPMGTKAMAVMGGHWLKVDTGWRWMPAGSTFPRPGADVTSVVLPGDNRLEACLDGELEMKNSGPHDAKDDAMAGDVLNMNDSIVCNLGIRDEDGIVVDGTGIEMTAEHVSSIVDASSELILAFRAGKDIDCLMRELEDHLIDAGVIGQRD